MPLILAIEPDRRQASQLTAMVRGRLHAELVLGESAERALAALGPRVPDLILTSALLSPKDENALGERLRALDGAAAHVQTLTIPVLASGSGRGNSRGGVLSALRRDKGKSLGTTEGCDPGVFAEQCKEYLERAESERAAFAERAAAAALDAQAEASTEAAARPSTSVVRPASGRESKRAKHAHQSVVLPPPEVTEALVPYHATHAVESAVPIYQPPVTERTDPYVAPAADFVADEPAAQRVEEPLVKKKGHKSSRHHPQGIRSVLGLTREDGDGPASLLAAVAALEAEEHVEPTVAPLVETPQTYDPAIVTTPVVTSPVADSPITTSPFDPYVSYTPVIESYASPVERAPRETPVLRPPVVEPEPKASDELLDLSSLLDAPVSPSSRHATAFSEEPVVDVYELDNSLLTTTFEDVVRPLGSDSDLLGAPGGMSTTPRTDDRSWPMLDTLIADTSTFAPSAPAPTAPATIAPSGFSSATSFTPSTPTSEAAKPLSDILEALRRDAEQVPVASPPSPASPLPAFTQPEPAFKPAGPSLSDIDITAHDEHQPAPSEPAADDKKKKKTKGNPAQDEWGFFDPDQCGFAALIEKLEEITDKDDPPKPRRA
jgi:hypothetical protein